jgi:hypothetical protein
MNAFQAVRHTIQQEFRAEELPPFLNQTIEVFRKAHLYYRTFKQIQLFQRAAQHPSQGHPAIYGAAIQLVGDYTSIGYALNIVLVAKCTEDLLREYRQLTKDYHLLRESLKWQYSPYRPMEWRREGYLARVISPSLYLFYQAQVLGLVRRIMEIACYVLQVVWQSFKISMCLCDAYLILGGDSHARYEACTELVAEWDRYRNQLKEKPIKILKEIERSCALTDRILHEAGATKRCSFIIENLRQKLGKLANQMEEGLNEFGDITEETLDTFYVKDKIIPLHLNLAEGKAAPPALPRRQFPPWAGQKVSLIPKPTNLSLPAIDPFEDSWKGLVWLAERLHGLYKNQIQRV